MRPDDRKYAESHEWVKLDGDTMLIGITDFAVQELSNGNDSDLVYSDIRFHRTTHERLAPERTLVLIHVTRRCPIARRYLAEVAGEVVEVNGAIEDHLEILATDPWNQGWMIRIKPDKKSLDGLLDAEEYEKLLEAKT